MRTILLNVIKMRDLIGYKDLSETVRALSRLIKEVQEDVGLTKDVWNRVFVR